MKRSLFILGVLLVVILGCTSDEPGYKMSDHLPGVTLKTMTRVQENGHDWFILESTGEKIHAMDCPCYLSEPDVVTPDLENEPPLNPPEAKLQFP